MSNSLASTMVPLVLKSMVPPGATAAMAWRKLPAPLFNEPFTASGTVTDYPTLGDVNGDGVVDIVLGGYEGIFVLSHIGRWVDSRPLWNQHNYHITNINDDWSVPISEQNSWALHNTYRTQTPERTPSPSYQLTFTY